MTRWVRLWEDMPTDPKWRVVARRAGRSLPEVLAVFVFMMARASQEGVLAGWDDEDVAAALDMDAEAVCAIRDAMQGKTLEGDALTGWTKRQPKREDGSAERAKAWREHKKIEANATERNRTQPNAPDTDTDTDRDTEKNKNEPLVRTARKRAETLPADFPKAELRSWASARYPTLDSARAFERSRDWALQEGKTYKDWDAFGRNWIEREAERKGLSPVAPNANVTPLRPNVRMTREEIDAECRAHGIIK